MPPTTTHLHQRLQGLAGYVMSDSIDPDLCPLFLMERGEQLLGAYINGPEDFLIVSDSALYLVRSSSPVVIDSKQMSSFHIEERGGELSSPPALVLRMHDGNTIRLALLHDLESMTGSGKSNADTWKRAGLEAQPLLLEGSRALIALSRGSQRDVRGYLAVLSKEMQDELPADPRLSGIIEILEFLASPPQARGGRVHTRSQTGKGSTGGAPMSAPVSGMSASLLAAVAYFFIERVPNHFDRRYSGLSGALGKARLYLDSIDTFVAREGERGPGGEAVLGIYPSTRYDFILFCDSALYWYQADEPLAIRYAEMEAVSLPLAEAGESAGIMTITLASGEKQPLPVITVSGNQPDAFHVYRFLDSMLPPPPSSQIATAADLERFLRRQQDRLDVAYATAEAVEQLEDIFQLFHLGSGAKLIGSVVSCFAALATSAARTETTEPSMPPGDAQRLHNR